MVLCHKLHKHFKKTRNCGKVYSWFDCSLNAKENEKERWLTPIFRKKLLCRWGSLSVQIGHLKELGKNICFERSAEIRLRSFRENLTMVYFFFQGKHTSLMTYGNQPEKVSKLCSRLELFMDLEKMCFLLHVKPFLNLPVTTKNKAEKLKQPTSVTGGNLNRWKCWWMHFLCYFYG